MGDLLLSVCSTVPLLYRFWLCSEELHVGSTNNALNGIMCGIVLPFYMCTAIIFLFVSLQVCVYKFVISTPLVCTKHLESTALRKLDELGVFGFSSGNNNKDVKQGANKGAKSGSSGARKAGKMSTQGRN